MSASTDLEPMRRRDVEIRPARVASRARRGLQHAHRGGADGHDAPAGAERLARRGGDLVPLAVDLMLVDELALERPERVEPDVERDGGARRPGLARRSSRSGVKCRPAVGAAADPGGRA